MMCAWDALLGILPRWMRQDVDKLGRYTMQELRMRINSPPELILEQGSVWLSQPCGQVDINNVVQSACRYSPWAAQSMKKGFLTAPGGHRLGLCGLALYRGGQMTGLREITSVCIRVARDYPGIAREAPRAGALLILGAPGWGKTTLLRDLIRQRSEDTPVSVVDERGELFPQGIDRGIRVDVLRGCRKAQGLQQLLRTMGPGCIALDEITEPEDCLGLIQAAGCGVTLLATAHAGSEEEFLTRDVYRPLVERKIFSRVLMLHPDKHFTVERISI